MSQKDSSEVINPDWHEEYRGSRVEVADVHAFNAYLQGYGEFEFLYGEPTIVLECYGKALKMALELQLNNLSDGSFNKLVNFFDLRDDNIGSIDISEIIGETITVSTYNNFQNAYVSVGRPKEEDSGWKIKDIETMESMLDYDPSIPKGYESRDLDWLNRILDIQDYRHQKETTSGWLPVNISYSSTGLNFIVDATVDDEIPLATWEFYSENKQEKDRMGAFKNYAEDDSGSLKKQLYVKPIGNLSGDEIPTPKNPFFLSENESWVLTHKPPETNSMIDTLKEMLGIPSLSDPEPSIHLKKDLRRAKTSKNYSG